MYCAMSAKSLQRAVDLALWAERHCDVKPVWLHPEYRRRFGDCGPIEIIAAARLLEGRNRERDRETAALKLAAAALDAARAGIL